MNSTPMFSRAVGVTQRAAENRALKILSAVCLPLSLVIAAAAVLPSGSALAQVAITLGAQEMYDDNIFLEDNRRRPPFVVTDDLIEEDIKRGRVPTLLGEEIDGRKNDDFITSLSFGLAGQVPAAERYATTILQGEVGFLLFADQTDQNRLTLDGRLQSDLTSDFLPEPYYATLLNEFNSSTSDSTAAEGTATRSTQVYVLTGRTGVRGIDIAPKTDFGAGYTGSLHKFLGELRFEDEGPGELQEEGADYHSHTAESEVGYNVNQDLRVALVGTAGVQIFTNADSNDIDADLRDEGELDRSTYTGTVNARYQATKELSVNGAVGVNHSSRFDDPEPREVVTFDKAGRPTTILVEREKDDTSLIFRTGLDYNFEPGSVITVGAEQSVGTDIDGDRVTSRSVNANATKAVTDRLSFTLGGRFLQYSTDNALDNSTDRFEGSTALSYLVTQQTSVVLGYNYVDQTADDDRLEEQLSTRAEDYTVNRVFVGVNVGFVGLPL